MKKLTAWKVDPSRTALARRYVAGRVRRGYRSIRTHLVSLIATENVLGLGLDTTNQAGIVNQRWRFHSNSEKVRQFRQWLKDEIDENITDASDEEVWRRYVETVYNRGRGSAFQASQRARKTSDATVE